MPLRMSLIIIAVATLIGSWGYTITSGMDSGFSVGLTFGTFIMLCGTLLPKD